MSTPRITVTIAAMCLASASVTAQEYWYAANGRGELIIDSTRLLVKFEEGITKELAMAETCWIFPI